jgi:hypothetical protein
MNGNWLGWTGLLAFLVGSVACISISPWAWGVIAATALYFLWRTTFAVEALLALEMDYLEAGADDPS